VHGAAKTAAAALMTSPACFSDTFSYTAADGHGDVSNSATVTVQMSLNGVTVTGTAQEGQTLTANPTNVESVTGYQWQSSNNGGTSWTNISSATNSTYLVQEGTVGLDWNFSGVGSFTGTSSLSQILLRNAASGSFELYQITSGGVLDGQAVAPVGNNFQVKGFGHFSQNTTTQMLMQDTSGDASSGQLELYTYQPSTASFGGINVGKVGLNLNIVGTADLRGIGSTQMVMQQDNGNFWLYTYDPNTNSLSGQLVGAIGSNFHVVGFGTLGVAGKDGDVDAGCRRPFRGLPVQCEPQCVRGPVDGSGRRTVGAQRHRGGSVRWWRRGRHKQRTTRASDGWLRRRQRCR
jgi:hypothetical protein